MVYWVVVRDNGPRSGPPAARLGPFDSVAKAEAAARARERKSGTRPVAARPRVEIVCDYA